MIKSVISKKRKKIRLLMDPMKSSGNLTSCLDVSFPNPKSTNTSMSNTLHQLISFRTARVRRPDLVAKRPRRIAAKPLVDAISEKEARRQQVLVSKMSKCIDRHEESNSMDMATLRRRTRSNSADRTSSRESLRGMVAEISRKKNMVGTIEDIIE